MGQGATDFLATSCCSVAAHWLTFVKIRVESAWHVLESRARIDADDFLRTVPDHGRLVLPVGRRAEVVLRVWRLLAQRLNGVHLGGV